MTYEIKELLNYLFETDDFRHFKDDDLVDMFRIWDCYAQDWVPDSPVLLRFESNDVIVSTNGDGPFAITVGPVDTAKTFGSDDLRLTVPNASAKTMPHASEAVPANISNDYEDECFFWLRVK